MITAKEARNNVLEYQSQPKEKYPLFMVVCRAKQRYLEKRIFWESKEGRSYYVESFPMCQNITYKEARCIIENMFMYLMHYGYNFTIWQKEDTVYMKISWEV